jgi:transcriptional regulator with XRE-family HTH domain
MWLAVADRIASVTKMSCYCSSKSVIKIGAAKGKYMNLQQRRLEKEWSQEQLARYSGLSTRTIQRIENGQKVGLESLKCLAAVFEISTNTLTQEQYMNEQKLAEHPHINKAEREAINFAQLLFRGPKKGEKDPLMRIERDAIDKVKAIWKTFKK